MNFNWCGNHLHDDRLLFWALIKVFWQYDEEPFLLTQPIGEECLVSDRILKLLRRFRRKKIGEFLVFWATGMVST